MSAAREIANQVPLHDGFGMPVLAVVNGAPDGYPVICLHSLFFTGEMFRAFAHSLASGNACFAPTYRGHAGLADLGKQPSVAQLARDILEWFDLAGFTKVHLVGSSMGAYVAMEMMRTHTDRIASVVLSCCTCEKEPAPERFAALANFISAGPQDTTARVVSGIMFGEQNIATPSRLVQDWMDRFAQTPAAMAQAISSMFAHPDYSAVLDVYHGPALLCAGAHDRAKSVADMDRIATHLPQADCHVFKSAGHTPAIEAPEEFAKVVGDFIARVERSRQSSGTSQAASEKSDRNYVS